MKRLFLILLSVLAMVSIPIFAQQNMDWTLVSSKNGILVYNRNSTDGGPSWIKGDVTDSVPFEVLAKVLLDFRSYPKWMQQLKESSIVHSTSEDDFILYNYYDLPWPMADRDVYVHIVIHRDLAHGKVNAVIQSIQDRRFPAKEGVIRVPTVQGQLMLQSFGPNRTRGVFFEALDIGGSVPRWGKEYMGKKMPNFVLSYVKEACRDSVYIRSADTSKVKIELLKARAEGLTL